MKLSDAMMLGSITMVLEEGNWNSCALGCAGNAVGIPKQITGSIFGVEYTARDRWDAIVLVWPWLETPDPQPFPNPDGWDNTPDYGDGIWARFDYCVCSDTMSFADLVEYVRSIEPECGDCKRFTCVCALMEQAEQEKESVRA